MEEFRKFFMVVKWFYVKKRRKIKLYFGFLVSELNDEKTKIQKKKKKKKSNCYMWNSWTVLANELKFDKNMFLLIMEIW